MFSYGSPHMAKQGQGDRLEPTCSSSVRIRDVAQRTCQNRWTIGRSGERGSEISVFGLVWLVWFYGISTFVGYLTPNPFLCKWSVLLKTVQFSISTRFNCQKHFHFILFKQLYVIIQLSVNTVLMSKNSSIWNNSVKHKHAV